MTRCGICPYLFRGNTSEPPKSSKIDRPPRPAAQSAHRAAAAPMRRAYVERWLGAVPARYGGAPTAAASASASCRPARVLGKTLVRLEFVGTARLQPWVGPRLLVGVAGLEARDMPTDHLDVREGFGGSSITVCSMILSARRPASVPSTPHHHPRVYPPLALISLITTSALRRGRCRPILGWTWTSGLPE